MLSPLGCGPGNYNNNSIVVPQSSPVHWGEPKLEVFTVCFLKAIALLLKTHRDRDRGRERWRREGEREELNYDSKWESKSAL